MADRISGIFVPVVMAAAIVTFGIWWIVSRDGSAACRGRLGGGVPLCAETGHPDCHYRRRRSGAKHGLLTRGGEYLEAARSINAVVLDKTGTVTRGKPFVSDVVAYPGTSSGAAHELLRLTAGL